MSSADRSPFGKRQYDYGRNSNPNAATGGENSQMDFAALFDQAADPRLTLPSISADEMVYGQYFIVNYFFVQDTIYGKRVVIILDNTHKFYLPNRMQNSMLASFGGVMSGETRFIMRFEGILGTRQYPQVQLRMFRTFNDMVRSPLTSLNGVAPMRVVVPTPLVPPPHQQRVQAVEQSSGVQVSEQQSSSVQPPEQYHHQQQQQQPFVGIIRPMNGDKNVVEHQASTSTTGITIISDEVLTISDSDGGSN